MTSSNLGNVLTRLQGLKNVSRKKVLPGAEFLQELEPEAPDVSGTASKLPNFANFSTPTQNMPESDLGGELTAQSYDVRANTATPPEAQDPSVFQRFGRALAQAMPEGIWSPEKLAQIKSWNSPAQTPPVETAQVDMQEGIPPVTASEQYAGPQAPQPSEGILGKIADAFSPTKRAEGQQYYTDLARDHQMRLAGKDPAMERAAEQSVRQEEIDKAMANPWQYSAYGSAQQVANHPMLQAKFKQITGVDYEPQVAAQVQEYETAMKGVEDSLNGINTNLGVREEDIKKRILSNQSTDADKYYVGLALLMPLLIGGLFGKEAGIGALAGGASGIADVLKNRQEGIKKDEEALLDVSDQKLNTQQKLANISLDKAKLGPEIRSKLPDDPNAHVLGMQEIEWQDPETGESMRGIRLKPGLIADPQYLSSEEGIKDMRKAANELSEVKSYVNQINDLTDDVSKIVTQLKDPSTAWKGLTAILSKQNPTMLSKMTQDVMFDGRKQNAGVLLEEKLGFLANAYGRAQDLGQLDRAAQNHIKRIIENPTGSFITPEDSLNQVLEIRKLAQRGLIENAANKGFYPQPIIQEFEQKNNPVFSRLNQREEDDQVAEIERELLKDEAIYAQ